MTIEGIRAVLLPDTGGAWQALPATGRKGEICLEGAAGRVAVHVSKEWVSFTARPPATLDVSESAWPQLLRASASAYMSKYSLDRRWRLWQQVEIAQVGLDADYVRRAIASLIEPRNLARAPAASIRSQEMPSPAKPARGAGALIPEIIPMDEAFPLFRTLHHEGWDVREHPRANHWRATYKSHERTFDVHVLVNPSWMSFQVELLPHPERDAPRTPFEPEHVLMRYLLAMNGVMYWAKFGLTPGGQILLALDLPLESFDPSRFRKAARTLATYLRETAYEVQILAALSEDAPLQSSLCTLFDKAKGRPVHG